MHFMQHKTSSISEKKVAGMDGVQVACLEIVLVVLKWKLMLPKKHGNVRVSSRRVHFQNTKFSVAPTKKKIYLRSTPQPGCQSPPGLFHF